MSWLTRSKYFSDPRPPRPPSRLHVRLGGQHRILRTPPGPEAVAVLAEGGIKKRLQHLQQRLVDQPVLHHRDTQFALARPASGSSPAVPDWAGTYPATVARKSPATRPSDAARSAAMSSPSTPADPLLAFTRCHACCRFALVSAAASSDPHPVAWVVVPRASGFVAGRFAHGFTARCSVTHGSLRHLTHGPRHWHARVHFHSFGPSLRAGSYYGLG